MHAVSRVRDSYFLSMNEGSQCRREKTHLTASSQTPWQLDVHKHLPRFVDCDNLIRCPAACHRQREVATRLCRRGSGEAFCLPFSPCLQLVATFQSGLTFSNDTKCAPGCMHTAIEHDSHLGVAALAYQLRRLARVLRRSPHTQLRQKSPGRPVYRAP
jgi:hypothetical protein